MIGANNMGEPNYLDGSTTPTHPTGLELVYDNGGTITAVSAANPLPTSATVTPAANQRVNTHSGDIASGSFASGAYASGSIGSGAIASGAVASGAYASGSIGSGAVASGAIASGAVASGAIASGAVAAGAIASGAAVSGAFADGAIVGIGTTTQAKATDSTTTSWSVIQVLKGIFNSLLGVLTVSRSTVAVYSLPSTATTSSSNSGDLTVGPYTEISIDINTTAKTGTTPTIQFIYARKAADGLYYDIWQSATITNVAANTISTSIGAGMAYNQSLGVTGQLRWVIGGSATPGYTFSANIQGK